MLNKEPIETLVTLTNSTTYFVFGTKSITIFKFNSLTHRGNTKNENLKKCWEALVFPLHVIIFSKQIIYNRCIPYYTKHNLFCINRYSLCILF